MKITLNFMNNSYFFELVISDAILGWNMGNRCHELIVHVF
jgi:hypothetical protein